METVGSRFANWAVFQVSDAETNHQAGFRSIVKSALVLGVEATFEAM